MMGRIRLTRLILISFFSLLVVQILIVEFSESSAHSNSGKGRRSPWIIF